jgi:hypothetical protein
VCGRDLPGLEYGTMVGFCEHGNEPSVVIKEREFLHQLSGY